MSGYFKHLAKQSSIAIRAPKTAVRGQGPPAHAEATHVVDSTPTAPDGSLRSQAEERGTRRQDAPEAASHETSNYPKTNEGVWTGKQSASEPPTFSDKATGLLDTGFSKHSRRLVTSETERKEEEDDAPDVSGGVIRVGEQPVSIEQTPTPEQDALSKVAHPVQLQNVPIPSDYLEGIREWLASPPRPSEKTESVEIEVQQRESVSNTAVKPNRSLHSNSAKREYQSQQDLQEFSLSIGTISIVVEEPARQAPQQSTNVQPLERPAEGQPRARDAFALSRSYFRGF